MTGIVDAASCAQLRRLTAHELRFLKQHSPGAIKMTLPSATQFPAILYKRGVTDRVYPDHSALLRDIVADHQGRGAGAGRRRRAATSRSTRPATATTSTPSGATGSGPRWGWTRTRRWTRRSAPTTPAWRGARRAGVTLAIHLCRGNNRSHWYAEGGYDPIAEKLFSHAQGGPLPRSSTTTSAPARFEPLRFVPRGKTVVLGLVSSKLPELESQDELVRRIEEAARYVPLEHLAPQPPVRLRLHDGGQPPHGGGAVAQDALGGGDGPQGVGDDLGTIVLRP